MHRRPRSRARAIGGRAALWLALGWTLLAGGCGSPPHAPRLLLIGIDGADWRVMAPLLEAGELPHLQQLMRNGTSGPLMSLYPIISPVIWTTIATGKGPDQHGVLDFTMPDPQTGQPIVTSSSLRRSKAFWNILSDQGLRSCVVGWWASWPAEPIRGVIVSDRVSYHAFIQTPEAEQGLVYPAEKQNEILALRRDAEDVPYETARQFMEITPQEYAEAPVLDFSDPISHFRHIYRTMKSYCEIAKHLIRNERPDLMAVYFEGVDTAGHMYMRYAPPEYPYTTAEERRKFGRTVEAFYRFQDQLLGELLALTDEQTTVMVVSDHGFLQGRERPVEKPGPVNYATAARWHRIQGVIVMQGASVRSLGDGPTAQGPLQRASVFDITPTMLALLGIPAGEDMEGRALTGVFTEDLTVPPAIPSHEDQAWRENRAAARGAIVQGIDAEMQERLRSLGYIGASEYEETLSLRAQWSLAEYFMFRRELGKAEQELQSVIERAPELPESYYLMGVIHSQRGEPDRARAMYEQAIELAPDKFEALIELATLYRMEDRRDEAIALLERAAGLQPLDVRIRVNLGMLHKELRHWEDAQRHFGEVLRSDPSNHPAHAQSALVCEELGRWEAAAAHWQAALRARPDDRTAQEHLRRLQEQGYGATSASPDDR